MEEQNKITKVISTETELFPIKVEPLVDSAMLEKLLSEGRSPEEIVKLIKGLVEAERARLSDILEISSNHTQRHPRTIEENVGRKFRRTQYTWLMAVATVVLIGTFVTLNYNSKIETQTLLALGVIFLATVPSVVSAIVLNARERDADIDRMSELQSRVLTMLDNFSKTTINNLNKSTPAQQ